MSANRVIALRGTPVVDEQNDAAAVISPGMLLNFDANGDLVPHETAGHAEPIFALERDEAGRGIGNPTVGVQEPDYAVGDAVKVGYFAKGDRVNALVASGQTVAVGDYMHSAGDGTLQVGATNAAAVGIAAEDLTATETTHLAVIVE